MTDEEVEMRAMKVIALVTALLFLVGVPASAMVEGGVPIRGTVVGVDGYGAPIGCPPGTSWKYFSSGGGVMSHLGRVEFDAIHCTVFDESAGTGSFGYGTFTLTAANGDTLVIAQSGTFRMTGDVEPGEFFSIITGVWTVVDGDGRFEGASGSGTLSGVSDIFGGTTTVELRGRIDY
jgi:hypothetical protein